MVCGRSLVGGRGGGEVWEGRRWEEERLGGEEIRGEDRTGGWRNRGAEEERGRGDNYETGLVHQG